MPRNCCAVLNFLSLRHHSAPGAGGAGCSVKKSHLDPGILVIVLHLSGSPLSVLACGQAWDLDFMPSSSSGQLPFPTGQTGHRCFYCTALV